MRPRILLADDHPIVLNGFQRLLESQYEIVGAVEDGAALVAEAELKQPDLVLVQHHLEGRKRHAPINVPEPPSCEIPQVVTPTFSFSTQ